MLTHCVTYGYGKEEEHGKSVAAEAETAAREARSYSSIGSEEDRRGATDVDLLGERSSPTVGSGSQPDSACLSRFEVAQTLTSCDAVCNMPSVMQRVIEPTLFDLPRSGCSIASNGYVLIRVGINHHLADARGYAYEHRLVAERKIGRRLKPEEHVHHVNHNKQDSRSENLEVMASLAEHFVEHRKPGSNLQLPGELNPLIFCSCGCGDRFSRFDESGRPREFVSGHNPQPAPTKLAVLATLASGKRHVREIIAELGTSRHSIAVCLSKLKRQGLIEQKGRGTWQLRA